MKANRKQKDRFKNAYLAPINTLWQNIRTMPKEDWKAFEEYVKNFDTKNCSAGNYHAKDLILWMIEHGQLEFGYFIKK